MSRLVDSLDTQVFTVTYESFRLSLKVSVEAATKETSPLMTCPCHSFADLTLDQSQLPLPQRRQHQQHQHVQDLDLNAPMDHALTGDLCVTIVMIVEMVLMKLTVVCIEHNTQVSNQSIKVSKYQVTKLMFQ